MAKRPTKMKKGETERGRHTPAHERSEGPAERMAEYGPRGGSRMGPRNGTGPRARAKGRGR
jgi:hypothetical protein